VIPGEHGPTGPIENMAGFFITANGQPVKWERDKVDMFAYHLTVPQGVTKLEIEDRFLASSASVRIFRRWFDERKTSPAELEHAAALPRRHERERGQVHPFEHALPRVGSSAPARTETAARPV